MDWFTDWIKGVLAPSSWETFRLWLETGALIAVAALAILQEWIKSLWNRTSLSLRLSNPRGIYTRLNQNNAVHYYHLEVINKRITRPARNTRVLLTRIYRKTVDGNFREELLSGPLQFLWMPEDAHAKDPFPTIRMSRMLDFGCLYKVGSTFIPRLTWMPKSFRGFVYKVGKGEDPSVVRYGVRIDSDSYVSTESYYVEVSWDGNWSDDDEEMAKHLIVREVKDRTWLREAERIETGEQ